MELSKLLANTQLLMPEVLLFLGGFVVLLIELTQWKQKRDLATAMLLLFFGLAMLLLVAQAYGSFMLNESELVAVSAFDNAYLITPFAALGKIVVLVAGILTVLASLRYVEIHQVSLGEYMFFITTSLLGMFVFLSANDFLVLFLGLELISFPTYILTGIKVKQEKSCEAGLKYLVMGAFSSALLLFGIALVYGAVGTTHLEAFDQALAKTQSSTFYLGLVFLLVGFGFKLSLFPFHAWTPDVYEGAPTPITAFMSVTMKVAVFMVFIRLFAGLSQSVFVESLAVIALLSIIFGNFYGLVQENVKRLLAYSAIAHAGYIMLGFLDVAHRSEAAYGMVFYLINYTFMNMAALFVLVYLTSKDKYCETLSDLKGLGRREPWLGFVMIVAVFSLSGLPPTPGFLAKFYVFKAALQGGYVVTVVLALISTLISLYYYLKILIVMYMEEETATTEKIPHSVGIALTMAIAVAALLYLGIFPSHALSLLPIR
jgi:NADH-quinone oxidoreductase subunit N